MFNQMTLALASNQSSRPGHVRDSQAKSTPENWYVKESVF